MPTLSDRLCESLAASGCTHVWGLGSAMIDGLLQPLRRSSALVIHGASTEKDAVFAADGATRVAPVPGVAAFIGSVGMGMALPGIQTAVLERRPLVIVIGQTDADAPVGGLQDTRPTGSRDVAVVTATGCAAWPVHHPRDLVRIWPDVCATLAASGPVALLVDESCFGQELAEPLPPPRVQSAAADGRGGTVSTFTPRAAESLTRERVWQAIAAARPGGPAFADAGQARHVGRALVGAGLDIRFFDCPRSAPLGWAVPAALGAAVQKGERTFAVCGDGGLLMSLAALADIGRHSAPVTMVVAANGILGVDAARGEMIPPDLILPDIDIVATALALGVPASRATNEAELVDHLGSDDGPQVIVVDVPDFEAPPAGSHS